MAEQHTENHKFNAHTEQLLHLMIHSLYSNKEIFLRELVSNAADAADKLRFKALENNALYEDDANLRVRISFDKDAHTITIDDNGIGMTREEVIDNLGTIARSGTKEFFGNLTGDQAADSQLIGQFGVGFYSSFIVSDKVTVETRAAGSDKSQGVRWVSEGKGEFEVTDIEKADRGTRIKLHLRDEEQEFLNDWKLRSLVTKYSDHISIPVEMYKEGEPEKEGDDGEKIPATEGEWEAINRAQALWTRSKSEVTDDEYKEFYKHISHDFADPLIWSHNKVEGKQQYTSLLYIPSKAPWDMWNRDHQHGLKLYVQRVFIMDDAEQFMPNYLRFVKGVLDSNDLPLNVSREILQDTKITANLRQACTKRALSMLEKLAKREGDEYQKFYKEFGNVLKEGPAEDFANRERIAKLLRFASTHSDSSEPTASLDDYVSRMKEEQDKIYYITADSYEAAAHSPHLEIFRKKGIEVLLMHERIDEWLMNHLTEFDGKEFVSVTKGDLDLGKLEDDEELKKRKEQDESEYASFIDHVKEILGDKVKDVRLTYRLTDTPSCIVVGENDMSTQMIKLMQAAGQSVPEQKYIFELNPDHSLVKQLADEQDEQQFAEWTQLLLQQAELAEKGSLENPADFVQRVNRLLGSTSVA
ncbi:molecular chaperone HtpG [Celerinatantimonas diazotrophica]|uniref:Chaperone protein HtpG n=1 Tax=Celerinatantimonas diazotrophica TaxID=412034 RepID=A0A4R1J7U7_9GAMM|nr:molecular chaperone HtpG [Celerinatantimonas diazotrophica]TCK46552.1 molecular chaperone HtpG [Celerinatantimonas diazotrophica]CAG9296602.1 Chaperone protein HtpG [Celerinatantimonas diazotrophica]